MDLEKQLVKIVATDRIDIPISSMSGRLKRSKPQLAKALGLSKDGETFEGDRVYARVEEKNYQKARGLREGVEVFAEIFPQYGKILNGIIEEERTKHETHLYFEMYEGCKVTSDDYLTVMENLGFTPATARDLYPELMDVSRKISRKRDEERSILIG